MFPVRENTKLCLLYAISGMLVVMIQIPGTACMVWYENFTSFFYFVLSHVYIYKCNHTGWIEVSPYTTFCNVIQINKFLLNVHFDKSTIVLLFFVILYAWKFFKSIRNHSYLFSKIFKFLHKIRVYGWLAWNMLFMLCKSNSENFNILII